MTTPEAGAWKEPSKEEIMERFKEFIGALEDHPPEERFELIMTHYGYVIDQKLKASEETVERLFVLTAGITEKYDNKPRAFLALAGIIAAAAPSPHATVYALAALLLQVSEINSHLATANEFLDKLLTEDQVAE